MNTWTDTTPGYRTKTIVSGNYTIVVHRPVLTEKERAKRERAAETALAQFARTNNKKEIEA